MTVELKQRHKNERREFLLEPDHTRLFVKDFDGEMENFVEYETVTRRTRTIVRQDGKTYVAAISFGLFALLGFGLGLAGMPALMRWSPLWAVASAVFFAFHLYKRRRYLLLDLTEGRASSRSSTGSCARARSQSPSAR